jgi:hypothetical protein
MDAVRRSWHPEPTKKMTKYTRTENNLIFATISASASLYFIFISNDAPGPEGVSAPRWAELLASAVFAVLVVRSLRGGAFAAEAHLQVRNLFRTQTFPWSEVSRFTMGLFPVLRYPSADVVLKDGRRIRITMLAPPNPGFRPNNKEAEILLEKLEDELEAARKRDGPDSSP